jgi:hypothetical protein
MIKGDLAWLRGISITAGAGADECMLGALLLLLARDGATDILTLFGLLLLEAGMDEALEEDVEE